ncbi:MAG: hypothetical protein H0U21_09430 [Acidimicrobiia bacterium]|nr:hypothetical protein [Acidimicrobiia bacterium]
MPTTYKVLGQVNPAATTDTTLYTVPAATSAVVSTISVAQLAAGFSTFRIAVRPAGAAIATKHYLAYDVEVYEKTAQTLTLGVTLAATDVITVRAGSANVAFSAFGSELT